MGNADRVGGPSLDLCIAGPVPPTQPPAVVPLRRHTTDVRVGLVEVGGAWRVGGGLVRSLGVLVRSVPPPTGQRDPCAR